MCFFTGCGESSCCLLVYFLFRFTVALVVQHMSIFWLNSVEVVERVKGAFMIHCQHFHYSLYFHTTTQAAVKAVQGVKSAFIIHSQHLCFISPFTSLCVGRRHHKYYKTLEKNNALSFNDTKYLIVFFWHF